VGILFLAAMIIIKLLVCLPIDLVDVFKVQSDLQGVDQVK